MVLPMAVYFHRATVFALPANMVSIPLVAVLAPLGLITFLASLVSSWLAALPGAALALLLHTITAAIQHLGRAQAADLRIPGPTLAHALLALACIAFCCWAVRRSRAFAWAAVAVLPLAATIALLPSPPAVYPGQLEVSAIDVGQGDSLLVVGPTGRTMLVDAGGPTGAAANAENATGASTFDVGEEVVSPYLWSRQFRRLDIVALTHAHSDHMGGMPAVLRNFRPRELWVAVDPNSTRYRDLLAEAASLGVRVRHLRAGDRIGVGPGRHCSPRTRTRLRQPRPTGQQRLAGAASPVRASFSPARRRRRSAQRTRHGRIRAHRRSFRTDRPRHTA